MNKFLKIGTVVLVVVCLLVASISVSAEGVPSFSFSLSQPSCGETFGYIEVLLQKSNGDLVPYVFCWAIDSHYSSSSPNDIVHSLNIVVTSSGISFYPESNYIEHNGGLFMFYISQDGSFNLLSNCENNCSSSDFSFPARSSIVGFRPYGNVEYSFVGVDSSNLDAAFNIVYSGQVDTNMLFTFLDAIYNNSGLTAEELANIESLLESFNEDSLSYLYDIWELLDNIDTNTSVYLPNLLLILNELQSYLSEMDSFLDGINSNTSSTKAFLYIELLNYLEWFDTYFADIEVSTASVEYFLYNDFSNYLATYLELFENYFWLQEDLITQPPPSSSGLSDSIQNNPPREDGKDIVGELDSAQNEALGGKTPEDVKQEIEDTLNSDKLKEELEEENEIEFEEIELEDITVVNQNVFNVVFDCFGGKWASYVVLSLSLAFACFIIGRRY